MTRLPCPWQSYEGHLGSCDLINLVTNALSDEAATMATHAKTQGGGNSSMESDWCKGQRKQCERRCGGADKTSFE